MHRNLDLSREKPAEAQVLTANPVVARCEIRSGRNIAPNEFTLPHLCLVLYFHVPAPSQGAGNGVKRSEYQQQIPCFE